MPLIQSVDPVGTPDEIRKAGQSTREWASCAPHSFEVMGCPHFSNCIFGFRGRGPKNVGVFIKLSSGVSAEKKMSCFAFMSGLYSDYKHQEAQGMMVQPIADEGEKITVIERVPEQPYGGPTGKNMRIITTTKEVTIPPFPRPGEEGSSLSPEFNIQQRLEARLKARAKAQLEAARVGVTTAEPAPQDESAEEQPEKEKQKAARR